MDRFCKTLEECGLADLGFEGDPFAWRNNSHSSSRYIREWPDRAVARLDCLVPTITGDQW